jgi:hypothetical protein
MSGKLFAVFKVLYINPLFGGIDIFGRGSGRVVFLVALREPWVPPENDFIERLLEGQLEEKAVGKKLINKREI